MADPRKKARVFIDANVLLSGNAFPRWSFEVLQHATEGDFRLVLCPLVIHQARKHLQRLFPKSLPRFEKFLRETEHELVPDPTPEAIDANQKLVRDLSDVAIALAAIGAGVDYILSEDKDLTTQDETTAELRRHLKVLLSGTFLREVMGWTSEELETIRHRQWSDMPESAIEKSESE
jgi:predicted nucleic acid-binding protein